VTRRIAGPLSRKGIRRQLNHFRTKRICRDSRMHATDGKPACRLRLTKPKAGTGRSSPACLRSSRLRKPPTPSSPRFSAPGRPRVRQGADHCPHSRQQEACPRLHQIAHASMDETDEKQLLPGDEDSRLRHGRGRAEASGKTEATFRERVPLRRQDQDAVDQEKAAEGRRASGASTRRDGWSSREA
jgi:hypothetical protein